MINYDKGLLYSKALKAGQSVVMKTPTITNSRARYAPAITKRKTDNGIKLACPIVLKEAGIVAALKAFKPIAKHIWKNPYTKAGIVGGSVGGISSGISGGNVVKGTIGGAAIGVGGRFGYKKLKAIKPKGIKIKHNIIKNKKYPAHIVLGKQPLVGKPYVVSGV